MSGSLKSVDSVDPIRIAGNRQLFLDDFLIASCEGVTRRVCPVQKHPANPVIRPDEPWEPSGYMTYGSVIYDDEDKLYKAWCHSVVGAPSLVNMKRAVGGGVFYFTSDDGIVWRKPKLDALLVDGNPSHLVSIWNPNWSEDAPPYHEVFGVFKDEQEPDPAKRYKLGFLYLKWNYEGPGAERGQLRGLGVAYSPDGIYFEALENPVTLNTSDGGTHWFRDPSTNRFVMYGRGGYYDPDFKERYKDDPRFTSNDGRAVRRSESVDFVNWEPEGGQYVMTADVQDGPGDEVYALNVFPYEGIYIGMVQVLHSYAEQIYLEIQLAVSRDSIHFERLSDRSPFIPVGGIGEWDRFNNSLSTNLPHRVGDDLRIYYGGRTYLHSGICQSPDNGKESGVLPLAGVGIATTKVDRFCGMEAGFNTGVLRTKPVLVEGQQLHINAHAPFGRVEVPLYRPDGAPIESATAAIQGVDTIDAPIAIDLASLAGQSVAIEFKITNAQLYSFWIE